MMSFCFFCVFVLINKVSLQETVEAVIGGSVVLLCSSSQHDLKLHDINVFWRRNNGKIVYDIIPGINSQEKQDPEYKNRIEAFPEEYERGNFSIKLNNLQFTDSGEYICFITHSDEQKTVQLIINESTAEENQEEAGSAETPWPLIGGVLSVFIVIVLVLSFIYLRKRSSSSHRANEDGMISDNHEVEHMNHNAIADKDAGNT